jgi:hypothetical protein
MTAPHGHRDGSLLLPGTRHVTQAEGRSWERAADGSWFCDAGLVSIQLGPSPETCRLASAGEGPTLGSPKMDPGDMAYGSP